MSEKTNHQNDFAHLGYSGIYLERSGEHAADLVETLIKPPELPLSDEQREEALAFETSLADHGVDKDTTLEGVIRGAVGEDIAAPLFFAKPFLEGKVKLEGIELPAFENEIDVYRWAARSAHNKSIPVVTLRKLAQESVVAYSESAASSLLAEEPVDDEATHSRSIVLDPEGLVDYAGQVESARSILKELRTVYKEGGERLDGAKRAIVDVYLARINEILAQMIPRANYLIAQSMLIGDGEMTQQATLSIPHGLREAVLSHRAHQTTLKRLDYLRNGMAINDEGVASAVDTRSLGADAERGESLNEAIFSPEEVAILKREKLTPEEMKDVFTGVLNRAGLLSAEDSSTWSPTRKTRAADELFQVVINPGQKTFAVDGISGAYKVASVSRSIYEAMSVGGFHELTHINQAQADKQLGGALKIARVKGKRVSMIREAGANSEQRRAEVRYFGEARPISSSYAHALKALEEGRGVPAAIEAFYREARRIKPDDLPEKAAGEAADRVMRLVRQGGLSSQALVYAEEAILDDEMKQAPQEKRQRATAVTSLDLVDQVRLHKYGLLPSVERSDIDWSELVVAELQPYIDRALHSQTNEGGIE